MNFFLNTMKSHEILWNLCMGVRQMLTFDVLLFLFLKIIVMSLFCTLLSSPSIALLHIWVSPPVLFTKNIPSFIQQQNLSKSHIFQKLVFIMSQIWWWSSTKLENTIEGKLAMYLIKIYKKKRLFFKHESRKLGQICWPI